MSALKVAVQRVRPGTEAHDMEWTLLKSWFDEYHAGEGRVHVRAPIVGTYSLAGPCLYRKYQEAGLNIISFLARPVRFQALFAAPPKSRWAGVGSLWGRLLSPPMGTHGERAPGGPRRSTCPPSARSTMRLHCRRKRRKSCSSSQAGAEAQLLCSIVKCLRQRLRGRLVHNGRPATRDQLHAAGNRKLGLVLRKSQPHTHEAYEEHDVKICILDVFPFSYLQASLVGGCTPSSFRTQPRTTARP